MSGTDDLEPFESPKILIEGAKASIPDFDAACKAFVDGCSYDVIDYEDPKTGEKVRKLRFKQKMPGSLRLNASNILNNLRHAMDQAVCDGAVELGRPDRKGLHFPFGKSATDLDNEIKHRLKNVDPDFVTFIRSFNPYYGGDSELYAFGSLSGPNKHQRVLRISLNNTGLALKVGVGPGFQIQGPVQIGGNKWSELRNELEIFRVAKGGTIQGQVNLTPLLEIVIGTGEPPLSGPAGTIFGKLASKIESIVLGLEAEANRLRAIKFP